MMPDPSAAREVLRCRLCQETVLVLTLESLQDARGSLALLETLIDAFKMRALLECPACIIRQQLEEAPPQ
jgi:hypothetical protein